MVDQDAFEAMIDAQFSEPIRIIPLKTGGTLKGPLVDTTRNAIDTVGYPLGPAAAVRAGGSSEFISRRAEADLLLKVQTKYLTDVRKGDRVELTNRAMTCEISFIEDGVHGRSTLHLIHPGRTR
jgi:hypothetical protein